MAENFFRPIALLTGILTLLQAIAWFVMSLLGILAYRCEMSKPTLEDSKFSRVLYFLYFQGRECTADLSDIYASNGEFIGIKNKVFANPEYINGWMATYLALNITYFFIALAMLISHCTSRDGTYNINLVRAWVLNTFAFLIMDFWLTIVWGLEYSYVSDFFKDNDAFGWVQSIPGALMAITARGFILYVINFSLFCYFIKYSMDWQAISSCCQYAKNNSGPHQSSRVPVQKNSIPRVPLQPAVWDNGQVLVPVRRGVGYHPNAVEGVTHFNDMYGAEDYRSPRQHYDETPIRQHMRPPLRPSNRIQDITDDPRPPMRSYEREETHRSNNPRQSVHSHLDYQDKRNFEQGGAPNRGGRGNLY